MEEFDTAIGLDPEMEEAYIRRAYVLLDWAHEKNEVGDVSCYDDYSRAIRDFERVIELSGRTDAAASVGLGDARVGQRRWSEAAKAYGEAIRHNIAASVWRWACVARGCPAPPSHLSH